MPAEYQPVDRLKASRLKLHLAAISQVEISERQLFEGVCDVLASRGGARWKDLDELWLTTGSAELRIGVGYQPSTATELEYVSIETVQRDEVRGRYRVFKDPGSEAAGREAFYELDSLDQDGKFDADGGMSDLASARLYSLLADAHSATKKEKLARDAYSRRS